VEINDRANTLAYYNNTTILYVKKFTA
jgi:hypothetical protein